MFQLVDSWVNKVACDNDNSIKNICGFTIPLINIKIRNIKEKRFCSKLPNRCLLEDDQFKKERNRFHHWFLTGIAIQTIITISSLVTLALLKKPHNLATSFLQLGVAANALFFGSSVSFSLPFHFMTPSNRYIEVIIKPIH